MRFHHSVPVIFSTLPVVLIWLVWIPTLSVFSNSTEGNDSASDLVHVAEVTRSDKVAEVTRFGNVAEVTRSGNVDGVTWSDKVDEVTRSGKVDGVTWSGKVDGVTWSDKVDEVTRSGKVDGVTWSDKVDEVTRSGKVAEAVKGAEARITRNSANVGEIGSRTEPDAISIYRGNPWYFQYRGKPVVLRGASDIDCPFQWTGSRLTDHLDLLVSVGGNYIRNTMSDRNEGDVYAFRQTDSGAYDLDNWNDEYWNRLEFFLEETARRAIIVQLSLWDQFDFHSAHPWLNNINIAVDPATQSAGAVNGREVFHEFSRSDFFRSVEDGHETFLRYQQKYIDRVLSYTLSYDHVLYNINNESSEGKIWENFWARHIKNAAQERNREVLVTTMQFDPTNTVRHIMTYSDLYDFYDISQNNQDSRGGRGPGHWDNLMNWRIKIASHGIKPMANEKIYGGMDGRNYSAGTESEAIDRFWRNIFAGCATARFHRPALPRVWGAGLNERVQTNLKALDMFLQEFNIFEASPHNDLLRHRVASAPATMEAYVTARIGKQYAVYFPPGRFKIDLDPWVYADKVKIRWLDIERLSWSDDEVAEVIWDGHMYDWGDRGTITLKTPDNRPYVALVEILE